MAAEVIASQPLARVRVRLSLSHRQYGIQQQHPLLAPFRQISVVGNLLTDILFDLLEDILQARRHSLPGSNREAQGPSPHPECGMDPVL